MAPVPLPADFRLRFAAGVLRPKREVLIGGAPMRILRLTEAGAARVDGWMAGRPVGAGHSAGILAARLVEAGLAAPLPPATPALNVAVVMPVRDDAEGVAATLAALGSTAPGVPVVVVDDGSQPALSVGAGVGGDRDVALVRRDSSGGPAAARNAGFRELPADVDVVVFVDAGCVPAAGWLPVLLAHFADPGLAAVAPRVRSRAAPGTPEALARYEAAHSPLDMGADPGPVRPGTAVSYIPTAVIAVRCSALRDLGGFDESLRFGEDVDLVWRMDVAGWRVRYEPGAQATHPARSGFIRWLRQRFDYGRSATPLAARHGRAVAPLTVSPWSLAAWCLLATGHPAPAAAITAASAEALAHRAGTDPDVAQEMRRLAIVGNIRAGGPIASAVRRAWLPPAVVAGALTWAFGGRRARRSVAVAAAAVLGGPGLADWWTHRAVTGKSSPAITAGAAGAIWAAWCLADDLAYQAGVWDSALRARSPAALLPRWWRA
ncbi:MAG TPA: mycofactocin biosynthesis glycosyltransferase MftF [Acidimicrobiales bacterium]|nr:mycofactocin biosynthesis glycosyltransferase MftF [Acidimicrobiales bacterium]